MQILVVLRNLYNNPDPFDEESILCDSDINVLTEACSIKDTKGGILTALLVSESSSDYEKVLKKAASYGADRIVHAPCDGFDFSDANGFARLIAELIKDLAKDESAATGSHDAAECQASAGFDLVMFGRLAYDGDSVNIATQVAENLEWHRAMYSSELEEVTPELLRYKKALDDGGTATTEVPLPAVVHTVRKRGLRGQARIADILRAYGDTTVEIIPGSKIEDAIGRAKSGPLLPTPVQEIPPYSNKADMVLLNGTSDVDTAANIITTLKSLGFEPR